ncbi:hypothetical protein DY000_02006914 [Brassica cretica]|uniref:Uncharacterized protein n=1 Tax=Brassica cretica TaxID=69181 RepID=A0ABQ7CM66_BRACR|nr:hypothetical protein DY000_02006914 [Brassica cretica]
MFRFHSGFFGPPFEDPSGGTWFSEVGWPDGGVWVLGSPDLSAYPFRDQISAICGPCILRPDRALGSSGVLKAPGFWEFCIFPRVGSSIDCLSLGRFQTRAPVRLGIEVRSGIGARSWLETRYWAEVPVKGVCCIWVVLTVPSVHLSPTGKVSFLESDLVRSMSS